MKDHHTYRIERIIKGKPQWVTRWGMTLLFCFFCLLFLLTVQIPYQESAKIDAEISGINEIQPAFSNSLTEFIISCKMPSSEETLKIRTNQTVKVRLMTLKRKELTIAGKIKQLYKSTCDHETMTLMISATTSDASETRVLLSTPVNSVHLDIITGETILFKQLLGSVASNFRTAKF